MKKYFFNYNIIFLFKVMGVLVLSITYYLVITLVEQSRRNEYLLFDSNTDAIEGVYKTSFDNFLDLKKQLKIYEEEIIASKTNKRQSDNKMTLPDNNSIQTAKMGNLLMPLINDLSGASYASTELNNLYNGDSCSVMFPNDEDNYRQCAAFWSSILVKGMEQSITQMNVVVNTVVDELKTLDDITSNKTFDDILGSTATFSQYEKFVEYYLFYSYMRTVDLFLELKSVKKDSIFKTFRVILICYAVAEVGLFFVLIYFVYSSSVIFNRFLNFVGIFPFKYLQEDEALYKDIIMIEKKVF